MKSPRESNERKIESSNIRLLKESKEKEVHIISSGPSIKDFDWKSLRGKDIMTLNDSIFYLPLKTTYHVYNEPFEKEQKNYLKMSAKFYNTKKFTTFDIPGWYQLNLYDDKNLAFMLAINLSIDLGYEKAFLYGYDFECIGGFIHWWDTISEKNEKTIKIKMELVEKQKIMFEEFKENISDKIILQQVRVKK